VPARRSIDDIIERRRREHDAAGERFVDLAIRFELDDEPLLEAGGRWDRRLDDFDGQAESGVVVRIHPGQRAAVAWFAAWLDAHADRRDSPPPLPEGALDADFVLDTDPTTVYSAMFAGGRRAGKTWIAVALAVAYAVRFPGAIVWLVSPADTQDDELRRYATSTIAPEWRDRETADGFDLCNGSRILFVSAYNPESLKNGEAHLVVLNEGQRMQQRAFVLARGAIVDRSGLVIVCANPPVEAKDQQWVSDFAAESQGGRRAAFYLHFNPLDNPHIDRAALLALKFEVDERTYDIEVLGKFLASKDAVAYNWNRLENERPTPTRGDVTSMFCSLVEEGDGILQVVGLDVQRIPYIGGPVYRFFGSPNRDSVLAWIVGEIVLDGGDEVDFCAAVREAGYLPESTLIVCDASGRWQHSRRGSVDAPPPEWRGRGSFDIIRGEGYTRIVVPDRRQKRNPHIVDRVRAFTSMICAGGVRRLFVDPVAAPRTAKALREWKTVNGNASRSQYEAHLGDGASYPIIRFFPRILTADKKPRDPAPAPPRSPDEAARQVVERANVAAGAKPLTLGSFRPPPSPRGRGSRGAL
jgi:hypothetical protein